MAKKDEAAGVPHGQNRTKFWKNEKVINYFLLVAKRAERPGVNWKRFREVDKKGIFSEFSTNQLTMFHKKLVRDKHVYSVQ